MKRDFSLPKGTKFDLRTNTFVLQPGYDFKAKNERPKKERPDGPLFVYLNSTDHVNAWVKGGPGPRLTLASQFLSEERKGRFTPDEVAQRKMQGVRPDQVDGVIGVGRNASIVMIDCMVNDHHIERAIIESKEEDSLILCCSTVLSKSIADGFGRDGEIKTACIEIKSFDLFRTAIEQQIGREADYGIVKYTRGWDRNHFLKHADDEWQQEYRLVWDTFGMSGFEFEVPEGVCRQVFF